MAFHLRSLFYGPKVESQVELSPSQMHIIIRIQSSKTKQIKPSLSCSLFTFGVQMFIFDLQM